MDRRDFMKAGALAASDMFLSQGGFAQLTPVQRIGVRLHAPVSMKTRLALRELCSGLHMLNRAWEVGEATDDERAGIQLTLTIEPSAFKGAEEYEIASTKS